MRSLCVTPIWWQTVLGMTPWEFPGAASEYCWYWYCASIPVLVPSPEYCWYWGNLWYCTSIPLVLVVGEVPTRIHLGRRPCYLEIDQELPKTRVKPWLLLQIMCYLSVTSPSGGGGIKAPMAQIQPLIFIFLIRRLCGRIAAVILDNRLSRDALTFGRISFCL